MSNSTFAIDKKRRAVFAREFDGRNAVDVKLIVLDLEIILDLPGLGHKKRGFAALFAVQLCFTVLCARKDLRLCLLFGGTAATGSFTVSEKQSFSANRRAKPERRTVSSRKVQPEKTTE